MSRPLGVDQSLALLEELKRAARELGGRAAKLSEDLRLKALRERKRLEQALQEHTKEAAVAHAGRSGAPHGAWRRPGAIRSPQGQDHQGHPRQP